MCKPDVQNTHNVPFIVVHFPFGKPGLQKLPNPLKPNSSNYYTLPYRPNLPFLISDIWALRN